MKITRAEALAGIKYWADKSNYRTPAIEIYVYWGRDLGTGGYIFQKRNEPKKLLVKFIHQLNTANFYPFLIDTATIREELGE